VRIGLSTPTGNGVKKYQPDDNPFDRATATDKNDFRWNLDFAGRELHNQPVLVEHPKTHPGVHLEEGLLYTALRTDPELNPQLIEGGLSHPVDLHRIARIIGANIYFDDSRKLIISWGAGANEKKELDKLSGNSSYQIIISNGPSDSTPHSEFKEYYNVLQKASSRQAFPQGEQFDVIFPGTSLASLDSSAKQPGLASNGKIFGDRIPCMSIIVGGGE
jgi:hypothetical protein